MGMFSTCYFAQKPPDAHWLCLEMMLVAKNCIQPEQNIPSRDDLVSHTRPTLAIRSGHMTWSHFHGGAANKINTSVITPVC